MKPLKEIPEPKKELADKWANEIIAKYRFTNWTSLDVIAENVANFFEQLFPDFAIDISDPNEGENCLFIRKKSEPPLYSLDRLLSVGKREEPDPETGTINLHVRETYVQILTKLNFENPTNYEQILSEIGLKPLEEIPEYQEKAINFWTNKIIARYGLSGKTPLEVIIKRVIQFFDMLFPTYNVSFVKQAKESLFPLSISKKADSNQIGWADAISKIRNHVYCTHFSILEKLNRENEAPRDPSFWFNLAIVFEKKGKHDKARSFGEKGLECNPKDSTELLDLIMFYYKRRRYTESIIYLEKAAELEPENVGILKMLASNYRKFGRHDKAAECLETVTKLQPNDKEAWKELVTSYKKQKISPPNYKFIRCFKKLIEFEPDNPAHWGNLGFYYTLTFKLGVNLQEILQCWKKVSQLTTNDKAVWDRIGEITIFLNNVPENLTKLRKEIEREPNNYVLWGYLGYLYAEQNNLREALTCWKKVTELTPNNKVAWAILALIQYEFDKSVNAQIYWKHAEKLE